MAKNNQSINQSIDLRLSVLQYTDVESRSSGCVLPFVEKTDQFRSFFPGAISSTQNQHWHVVLFFLKKKTDIITTKSTEYIFESIQFKSVFILSISLSKFSF